MRLDLTPRDACRLGDFEDDDPKTLDAVQRMMDRAECAWRDWELSRASLGAMTGPVGDRV